MIEVKITPPETNGAKYINHYVSTNVISFINTILKMLITLKIKSKIYLHC